jgi:MoaA/NifB/PqqE/SkfB family radical SAM enzyme
MRKLLVNFIASFLAAFIFKKKSRHKFRNFFREKYEVSALERYREHFEFEIRELKRLKKSSLGSLKYVEVHIIQRCNLNCAHCSHFIPLVKEDNVLSLETFRNDFTKLAALTLNYIETIRLLGGEPLLNKDINKYMQIIRPLFPRSTIAICTNGLLLATMPDDFWAECGKQNIKIHISAYPVQLDAKTIKEKAKQYNVSVQHEDDFSSKGKPFIKGSLTLKEDGFAQYNYENCCHKPCCFLKEGRLYRCPVVANINLFNDFFHTNLPVTESNFIDLYKAKNLDEILTFLANPIPFCKYCDRDKRVENVKWKVSEHKIEEWVGE